MPSLSPSRFRRHMESLSLDAGECLRAIRQRVGSLLGKRCEGASFDEGRVEVALAWPHLLELVEQLVELRHRELRQVRLGHAGKEGSPALRED